MILKLSNLYKSYRKHNVLEDVGLTITDPRFIALIAPNGSGKTTLLNIICNLESVDSGNIEVLGKSNQDLSIFKNLSYMQDNSVLYSNLTGKDHIEFIQSVHRLEREQIESVTKELKMTNYLHKKVCQYSLGMKQTLLFALAILPKPRLLLMDEPLNGLDPASISRVRKILLNLYSQGTTILFSSHNLDQIDKLTNDIYFLVERKLIRLDQLQQAESLKKYELIVDNTDAVVQMFDVNSKMHVEKLTEHKCIFYGASEELERLNDSHQVHIYDFKEIAPSLEKYYFQLYGEYTYEDTQV